MAIKFVTFNVHNLFTRPKAMNLSNLSLGTEKLSALAELQAELARESYDAKRIVALANSVRGYFAINKTRGQTPLRYSKQHGSYVMGGVRGRSDWEGFISLTRGRLAFQSVSNTGKFIEQLHADIIGICEVENLAAMRQFRTRYLSRELRYEILIDGTDSRGIDVGLYSRFPLGTLRTNIHFRPPRSHQPLFPRDCMEVEIPLADNKSLWILQNHFKSKLGDRQESDGRREAQAKRVAKILAERYDLGEQYVIVAGDLNDTPTSGPLRSLLGNRDLFDALDVAGTPAEERWTYAYRREKQQIDYILISRALKARLVAAGVDRSSIASISKLTGGTEQPMDGITNWRNAASDHGAVWVRLDVAPVSQP